MNDDALVLGNTRFTSRLFTGTGKFAAHTHIPAMLAASGSQMITVALRRIDSHKPSENILFLKSSHRYYILALFLTYH